MEKTKGFTVKKGKDMPLGLSLQNDYVQFAVSMPGSSSCDLVLYKKGEMNPAEVIPMEASALGVFSVCVKLPKRQGHTGFEYLYRTGETYVCDPYAAKINGREQFGVEPEFVRGEVFVPEEAVENTYHRHAASDLVLYKLHVRGFTMGNGAGTRKKGTYAGLVDKIPYLQELGVNGVLLMPVTEFDELEAEHRGLNSTVIGAPARTYQGQPEKVTGKEKKKSGGKAEALEIEEVKAETPKKVNYWGYTNGAYYFAPKTAYAYNREKASEEFKAMVAKLHEAGIDVYLEMMFDGNVSQSFMLDCLRYWVRVYGVDGFHISDAVLPAVLVAGDAYLQNTAFMITEVPNWLSEKYPGKFLEYRESFCTEMRRYLKGDEGMVPALSHYMKNRRTDAGRIHYIADHNGFTLADLYSYDIRHNEANGENGRDGSEHNFSWNCGEEGVTKRTKIMALRLRMMKNALALNFLSQGTPMLLAGDEFGRTKQGNNNAYCQDNEISWLDWSLYKKNKELFEFVKGLIALRKEHPLFTLERELRENDFISCGWPEVSVHGITPWQVDTSSYNRLAAFLYCGSYVRRADRTFDDSFYVMFNMHWEKHEFELPKMEGAQWQVVFDTSNGKGVENAAAVKDCMELEARSIIVLKSVAVPKEETIKEEKKEDVVPKKKRASKRKVK